MLFAFGIWRSVYSRVYRKLSSVFIQRDSTWFNHATIRRKKNTQNIKCNIHFRKIYLIYKNSDGDYSSLKVMHTCSIMRSYGVMRKISIYTYILVRIEIEICFSYLWALKTSLNFFVSFKISTSDIIYIYVISRRNHLEMSGKRVLINRQVLSLVPSCISSRK